MGKGQTKGKRHKLKQIANNLSKATAADKKELLDPADRRGLKSNKPIVENRAAFQEAVNAGNTPVTNEENQAANTGAEATAATTTPQTDEQTNTSGGLGGQSGSVDVGALTDEQLKERSMQIGAGTDGTQQEIDRRAKLKGEKPKKDKVKYEPDKTKIGGDDIIKYIYEEYWLAFLAWTCDKINEKILGGAGWLADKIENFPDWVHETRLNAIEGKKLNFLGKTLKAHEQELMKPVKARHDTAAKALNIARKMAANGGKFPADELDKLRRLQYNSVSTGGGVVQTVENPVITEQLKMIETLQANPDAIGAYLNPDGSQHRIDVTALADAMRGNRPADEAVQIVDAAIKANDASFKTSQKLIHASTELSLADMSQRLDLIDLDNKQNTAALILTGKDLGGNVNPEFSNCFAGNFAELERKIRLDGSVQMTDGHIEAIDKFLDETATRAEALNEGNKETMKKDDTIEGYKEANEQELIAIHGLEPNIPHPEREQQNDNHNNDDGRGGNDDDGRGGDNGDGHSDGDNHDGGDRGPDNGPDGGGTSGGTDGGTGGETGGGEAGPNENVEQEPITHKDLSQLANGSNNQTIAMVMANKLKNPDLDEQTRQTMEKVRKAYNSNNPEEIAKLNDGISTKEDAEIANHIAQAVEKKTNATIPDIQKKEQQEETEKQKEKEEKDQSPKTFEEQKKENITILAGNYAAAMNRGDKAEAERIQNLIADEALKKSPEEIAAEEKMKKENEAFYKNAAEINKSLDEMGVSLKEDEKKLQAAQDIIDKMKNSSYTSTVAGYSSYSYNYQGAATDAGVTGASSEKPKEEAKKEAPKKEMTPEEREKATQKMAMINNALKNSKGQSPEYVNNLQKQMDELKSQGIELPQAPEKPKKEKPMGMDQLATKNNESEKQTDRISKESADIDNRLVQNADCQKENKARKKHYHDKISNNNNRSNREKSTKRPTPNMVRNAQGSGKEQ